MHPSSSEEVLCSIANMTCLQHNSSLTIILVVKHTEKQQAKLYVTE